LLQCLLWEEKSEAIYLQRFNDVVEVRGVNQITRHV
jgi:hypothetical protein